jgi:hypothetical protein
MTKLTLLFDEVTNGIHQTVLSGPCFRNSTFVDYIARNTDYSDLFEFLTLDEAQALSDESRDCIYVFPIGIKMFFDSSIQSLVLNNTDEGNKLKNLFQRIRATRDDIYVMLDMTWECSTRSYVDSLEMIASLLSFPIHRLIYLANNPITNRLSGLPARFGYLAMGAWFFEFFTHTIHKRQLSRMAKDIESDAVASQCKLALSLNRRVRAHRVLLAAYLFSKGYLEDTFFSFGGRSANEIDNQYLRDIAIKRAKELAQELPDSTLIVGPCMDYITAHEPFEIDLEFKSLAQDSLAFKTTALATSNSMEACYRKSMFSIVTETDFGASDHDFLLTEKSFKPLLFGHPFIVFSGPGALRELRDLGYAGYDPIIPESYDGIFDPSLRFLSISKSIEVVFREVHDSPEQFRAQTRAISQLNRQNFANGTPRRVREFVARLIHEVRRLPTSGHRVPAALESGLASNDGFHFSSFSGVAFNDGFYKYEAAHDGRWCSAHGELTIWLGEGNWRLTLFLGIKDESAAPDVYIYGAPVRCEYARHEDRIAVGVALLGLTGYVTIQFHSKSTFVPAEVDKSKEDRRRLGFWLFDEFLVARGALDDRQIGKPDSVRLKLPISSARPRPDVDPMFINPTEAGFVGGFTFESAYGKGIAVTLGAKRLFELDFQFETIGGSYELWLQYAASESRPLELIIDDLPLISGVAALTTGGWHEEDQFWHHVTSCALPAGIHHVRLRRSGWFPHIGRLALLPIG